MTRFVQYNMKKAGRPCPVSGEMIPRANFKMHMRTRVKVGNKWVCTCFPEHPNFIKSQRNKAFKKQGGTNDLGGFYKPSLA